MSSVDWDEVKRLAADFQRAQLSSTAQRLSERNCIEIISYLIDQHLIDVVFTTDGKEYITPQHLAKEIRDELYVHGGRVNLVELAKLLSVDISIITAKASEIERSDSSITIINGQLIDKNYVATLCEEINEKLSLQGHITIGDLTSQYDLPGDYLLSIVERQIGKTIKGLQDKLDRYTFFTEAFVERNRAIIRGALLALTKPTSVATIVKICGAQEKLFFSIVDSLVAAKEMPGVITGRQTTNSTYIPTLYTKSQTEWVTNFYKQNGYLELTALSRLGIADPLAFIKKHFAAANLVMLSTCAVGPSLLDQVEAAVDDVISSGSLLNVLPILPSVFEEKDAEMLLNHVLRKKSASQAIHIFDSATVTTDAYLRGLLKLFDPIIDKNAQDSVVSGAYMKTILRKSQAKGLVDEEKMETRPDKKEERRKKAAEGKGGGGTQGRETKTKSTKKKYMKGRQNDDSDEDAVVVKNVKSEKLELVKLSELKKLLQSVPLIADEDSEQLVEEIAVHLLPGINKTALDVAHRLYESTISSTTQNRRKKHSELQDKLNDLVTNIRLFDKGLKLFPSKDTQQQLAKYLLKSVCTDVANEVFSYVAVENCQSFEEGKEMTAEVRVKVLNEVQGEVKTVLQRLNKSLGSNSTDELMAVVESAIGPGLCDVVLRKADKKRDRTQLLNHLQQLIEQLNLTSDPALVLHLSALIMFQGVTQNMLHASGRFVSNILTFLEPHIPEEQFGLLQKYHDMVLKFLTSSVPEEKSKAENALEEDMLAVKLTALNFKKTDRNRLTSD